MKKNHVKFCSRSKKKYCDFPNLLFFWIDGIPDLHDELGGLCLPGAALPGDDDDLRLRQRRQPAVCRGT